MNFDLCKIVLFFRFEIFKSFRNFEKGTPAFRFFLQVLWFSSLHKKLTLLNSDSTARTHEHL